MEISRAQEERILREYTRYRSNPIFDIREDGYFCSVMGVSVAELDLVKNRNPHLAKTILDTRRENTYATRMQQVDEALFKEACAGNTKAAEVLYRRFDGWDPTAKAGNKGQTFADMVDEMETSEEDDGSEDDIPK